MFPAEITFKGYLTSSAVTQFNRSYITYYYCSTVTMHILCVICNRAVTMWLSTKPL